MARAAREAELLMVVARLACASGCPPETNIVTWCLSHGLTELDDEADRLSAKASTRVRNGIPQLAGSVRPVALSESDCNLLHGVRAIAAWCGMTPATCRARREPWARQQQLGVSPVLTLV
jgi:hypothetical protein